MTLQRRRQSVAGWRIQKAVFRLLRANKLCSIATVSRGNRAHINTAFFAYSRALEFYFLSDPGSRHCRNLLTNPSMAMTIFNSEQEWDAPGRGIQLFGRAQRTEGRVAAEAEATYGMRFPLFARWVKGTTSGRQEDASRLRSYALFRFRPKRIKIMDEAEFGAAVFLVASVHRRRNPNQGEQATIAWEMTEVLGPSEDGRAASR